MATNGTAATGQPAGKPAAAGPVPDGTAAGRSTTGRMRRGRNAGGFTLIEIIIVIAIMGLLAGLVMTRGPTRSKRVELEATARALAGTLRLARGQAIANNRIAVVRSTPGGWMTDDGAPRRLPAGEAMNDAVVAFTPEGQSSGGVITIGQGDERIAVVVEWLTGRVAVTRPVAEPAS